MAKKSSKKPAKKTASKSASKSSSSKTKITAKAASAPTAKARKASSPKNSTSYTQSEFFENIRGFCGLGKRSHAKELCEDIAHFLRDSLRRGYKVPLMGLGKLYVRQTKPRMGRNPSTGESIHIPARKRVRFTPAKAFKAAVL